MKASELMTSAEAADFMGITRSWLNRLAEDGVIREYVKSPGLRGPRFFHRDEVTRVAVERELAS